MAHLFYKFAKILLCITVPALLIFSLTFPANLHSEDPSKDSMPEWFEDRSEAIVRIDSHFPSKSNRRHFYIKQVTNGVIVSKEGLILTVAHGLGDKDPKVYLKDGSSYKAEIITRNDTMDIAILKINSTKPLPIAPMNTTNDKLGTVWSLGQNEFGKTNISYGETVAQGINLTSKELKLVQDSESGRSKVSKFIVLPNLIIHKAFVGPGYSGGPLLNSRGEVVGINFGRAGTKKRGLSFSMSVRNFEAALSDFTMEMEILAMELEDGQYRYNWFLDGVKQHFLADGANPNDIKGVMKSLSNNKSDIRDSWSKFARINSKTNKSK